MNRQFMYRKTKAPAIGTRSHQLWRVTGFVIRTAVREVRKPTRLLLLRQLPTIGDAHRDPALELYTANRSMTTNKPIIKPNLAAAIAFAILMTFAVGKVLALASGSPALDRLHPLLPGTYRSVTNFAFSIELVSIFIWCLWGTKRFLQICGGLAVTYLSYHITSEVFGSRDSCSCLGQFTFWSEWVRRNERLLSISGSVALLSLSVFGLTPNACKVANNEIYTGLPSYPWIPLTQFYCGFFVLGQRPILDATSF